MSYIGSTPTTAAFPFDQFSGTGAATSFTLTTAAAGSTSILVTVSGVTQNPNVYSVAGTTLTFNTAPAVGTNNVGVLYLGLPAIVASPVSISNGGTGATTRQAAIDALAGSTTSGQYLRGNGTDVVMAAIVAGDVPTLNQNTTGTAANVTGTVVVANGGTGATTLAANNVLLGNGTSAFQAVAPSTSGNVLTSNGTTWTSAAAGGGFPAGTVMLFIQTAAPTGWTKSTTHDNKALRVVSGGVGSGGLVGFTTAFGTPSVSGSTSISVSISGTTGATTLSTAQMPSHNHTAGSTSRRGTDESAPTDGRLNDTGGNPTSSTGGGGSHTHSFSGSGSGSGSLTSGVATINVQYVDVIIATKN